MSSMTTKMKRKLGVNGSKKSWNSTWTSLSYRVAEHSEIYPNPWSPIPCLICSQSPFNFSETDQQINRREKPFGCSNNRYFTTTTDKILNCCRGYLAICTFLCAGASSFTPTTINSTQSPFHLLSLLLLLPSMSRSICIAQGCFCTIHSPVHSFSALGKSHGSRHTP